MRCCTVSREVSASFTQCNNVQPTRHSEGVSVCLTWWWCACRGPAVCSPGHWESEEEAAPDGPTLAPPCYHHTHRQTGRCQHSGANSSVCTFKRRHMLTHQLLVSPKRWSFKQHIHVRGERQARKYKHKANFYITEKTKGQPPNEKADLFMNLYFCHK